MIRNITTFMATGVLAIVAFALTPSAAVAQSYSGNFPLILTESQPPGANAAYCLTLTDNGTAGRPHSGPASLAGVDPGGPIFGTFQVIGQLLMVTVQQPSDTGESDGLMFVAPTSKGHISTGAFELVAGGQELSSNLVEVGTKDDCSP
jgi:hypothetical protein